MTVRPGVVTADLLFGTPFSAYSRASLSISRCSSRSAATAARCSGLSIVAPMRKPFAFSAAMSAALASMLTRISPFFSTRLYSARSKPSATSLLMSDSLLT